MLCEVELTTWPEVLSTVNCRIIAMETHIICWLHVCFCTVQLDHHFTVFTVTVPPSMKDEMGTI